MLAHGVGGAGQAPEVPAQTAAYSLMEQEGEELLGMAANTPAEVTGHSPSTPCLQ